MIDDKTKLELHYQLDGIIADIAQLGRALNREDLNDMATQTKQVNEKFTVFRDVLKTTTSS